MPDSAGTASSVPVDSVHFIAQLPPWPSLLCAAVEATVKLTSPGARDTRMPLGTTLPLSRQLLEFLTTRLQVLRIPKGVSTVSDVFREWRLRRAATCETHHTTASPAMQHVPVGPQAYGVDHEFPLLALLLLTATTVAFAIVQGSSPVERL